MSQQLIRYTLTLQERHLWGARVQQVIIGTGSSKKDDELLIFREGGGFVSVNYNHVIRLEAEPLAHAHAGTE